MWRAAEYAEKSAAIIRSSAERVVCLLFLLCSSTRAVPLLVECISAPSNLLEVAVEDRWNRRFDSAEKNVGAQLHACFLFLTRRCRVFSLAFLFDLVAVVRMGDEFITL